VTALGDNEKLKQVFLNLIINGVHAMEKGGELEIATGVAGTAPEDPARFHTIRLGSPPGGSHSFVTIRDHGSGIEREIMEKTFEPFFSTKAEGKGTGLGLYITLSIINEHRGSMTVSSLPGEGTVFRISLPRA
jgi:signal transduction histidine kinase